MKLELSDLPKDKIYVKLENNFIKTVIDKIREKYKSLRKFYKAVDISETSFYAWRRRQMYPLNIIIKFCELVDVPPEEIQRNLVELRSGKYPSTGGNISLPVYPRFPIKLTKELARILAHLFGDGCLIINKRGHYNCQYYNQSKELRELFKKDAKQIFGDIQMHEAVNKNTPYIFLPAPVSIIMLQLVPTFNSKLSKVPEFIKNASEDIKKEFIKAFFDDEASVSYRPPSRYIELTLSNKIFLEDIKELLKEFNIKTSKIHERLYKKKYPAFCFYIMNYNNIYNFWSSIGFYHPKKIEKLSQIIKFPGRKSYGRGETENLILELLNKSSLSSLELSDKLCRKPVTVQGHLRNLRRASKAKRFKQRSKILWKVI